MRVLLLLVVVFGSLPVILTQPFVGLLVYTWLAYMRPHDMVWGAIPQVSLFVALALIAGMVLAMKREKWITAGPQTSILIAFGGWFGLASLMAVDPSLSTEWTVRIAKILLMYEYLNNYGLGDPKLQTYLTIQQLHGSGRCFSQEPSAPRRSVVPD